MGKQLNDHVAVSMTENSSSADSSSEVEASLRADEELSNKLNEESFENINIKQASVETTEKSIAELQKEVNVLKNELKLYKEPFNLDQFNFRVTSAQKANYRITQSLHLHSHTLYKILSQSKTGTLSSVVFRRYSDFSTFASLLKKKYKICLIPKEPPKRKLNKTEVFVKFRLLHLNAFIATVLANEKLRKAPIVSQFLQVPSEQWSLIVERESLELASKEDFTERAKDYFISSVVSLNLMRPHQFPSDSEVLKSFLLNFERDFSFTFLDGRREAKSKYTLKAVFETVTLQLKKFINCYISLLDTNHHLYNESIILGMNYGGTDSVKGPVLLSLLHKYANTMRIQSTMMSSFIASISGIDISKNSSEENESFETNLVENCYKNYSIATGLKTFFESTMEEKSHTDKTALEAQDQLSWGIIEIEKNLSPLIFKSFAEKAAKYHEEQVNLFQDLLNEINSLDS